MNLCHELNHRHVFGGGAICLDMLETHNVGEGVVAGVGWSSGYTLQSILVQLQSFLSDESDLRSSDEWGMESSARAVKQFTCEACGHHCSGTGDESKCFPPLMPVGAAVNSHHHQMTFEKTKKTTNGDMNTDAVKGDDHDVVEGDDQHDETVAAATDEEKEEERSTTLSPVTESNLESLYRHWFPIPEMSYMYQKIFDYVDIRTLNRSVWNSCSSFQQLLQMNERYRIRSQVICYHTKMTFEEAALGYGLNVKYHPNTGVPQYVESKLDIVSYFAVFKEGIDTSMWRETFQFWLPIYINKGHGQTMLDNPKFFAASVERIYQRNYTPKLGLDLLTKLMNSMIVTVMQGVVHASLKAIDGYMAFHRLLIALIVKHPELKQSIDDKIELFLTNEQSRRKACTPSLGDFLPYLAVSTKYSWPQLAIPVLQEVLCRNVLWAVSKDSSLNFVTSQRVFPEKEQQRRHEQFFKFTSVSLHLIMFHVQFLKQFSPKGSTSLEDLAKQYDSYYGFANERTKNTFQDKLFQIQKVNNYRDFFKFCCLNVESNNTVDEILTDAWISSKQYGYHT